MGKGNFSDDFKRDAVAQITERGYRVSEVSRHPANNQKYIKQKQQLRWCFIALFFLNGF